MVLLAAQLKLVLRYSTAYFHSIAKQRPRITNHETRITNHETRITNHETRITNHETRITNHETRITKHESRITNHHPLFAFFCAFVFALAPIHANAAGLIRDAEIEHTLQLYSQPIFEAAGIPPEDVRLLIVDDPTSNAFVSGGLNIFIHTGLILATIKPGMLIGVIAHETGHISGAHLSQFREKSSRAAIGSVIGLLLGAAAAAGGAGAAAGGIIAGGQNIAQRSLLSEIRLNEASADEAALRFLDATDISATGMLAMFETLRTQESTLGGRDKFLSDHPLTPERITTMRNHIAESSIPADQVPERLLGLHARMLAKLTAFIAPYNETLRRYPPSNNSLAARYARAIAEFRHNRLDNALPLIDGLIKQYPKDPYFYDTKGQILFENGRLADAVQAYSRANSLVPNNALIATSLAQTLIAQDNPRELPRAIALLERAREQDDSHALTWRQLAIAYGKQGKLGESYAALAEEAALVGDYATVLQHVARARGNARSNSALQLQLDDLARDAKNQISKRKEADSLF